MKILSERGGLPYGGPPVASSSSALVDRAPNAAELRGMGFGFEKRRTS